MPIAVIGNDNIYYIHTDHLATPRLATDKNKQIVWQWRSTPFGKGEPIENGLTLNLRFPGQYFDDESKLHYNWWRYYQPDTGRYVTGDPTGLNGGTNVYIYAYSTPVIQIDFTGLKPGDSFKTEYEAALDASKVFWDAANKTEPTTPKVTLEDYLRGPGVEVGGWIIQNDDCSYTYTALSDYKSDQVDLKEKPLNSVADWHLHPTGDGSSTRQNFSQKDIKSSYENNVHGYLAIPPNGGVIKLSNPDATGGNPNCLCK